MKNLGKFILLIGIIAVSFLIISTRPLLFSSEAAPYNKISDIWLLTHFPLPTGYSNYFAASGECEVCHGHDTAHIASVDILGNDINLVDDWRSSMMANAARDPFWQAKVSHEVSVHPEGKEELESVCTTCHAPLARYEASFEGQTHYSMDEMRADSLGMDGVSCMACHKQTDERLGLDHSGTLHLTQAYAVFGPFQSPLNSPMAQETGYSPFYAPHISDAGICAGCHSLITPTVDLEGEPTGGTFVEQATYKEWQNSAYEDVQSCQDCHMPKIEKGTVFLAAGYETEPRAGFSKHEFVGANTFMLQLLRDNIDSLGLTASEEQFDESIAKSNNMLRNKSIQLEVESLDRTIDTAIVKVHIKNIAGHKFPSGYPSRRAFIQLTAKTAEGAIVFQSGAWDDTYEVLGQDPFYEPHYDTIRAEDQVQIYEMVVANVAGDRTTVLEQMAYPLKDNRLTPVGFTTSHAVYDTVAIVGKAFDDANFNKEEDGTEGTGSDDIFYHIPLNGITEALDVSVRVYYQTAPPRWMEELLAANTPEVAKFKPMFEEADRNPILVKEKNIQLDIFVGVNEPMEPSHSWLKEEYFNPIEKKLGVFSSLPIDIDIFNPEGKSIRHSHAERGLIEVDLSQLNGIYFIRFSSNEGHIYTKKILL